MDNKDYYISKITDLNLGELEELDGMTTAQVMSLYYELKTAQDAGQLDLETLNGCNNLEKIVNKYLG